MYERHIVTQFGRMMADSYSSISGWTAGPVGRTAAPLREQVTASVRQAIITQQLKPGQRLIERELIKHLGVSRTTIREALRELTSEGLLTVVPQKGVVVSTPSKQDAADLYEVRALLEALLVRLFVARATDKEVVELRGSLKRLSEAVKAERGVQSILRIKGQFYTALQAGAKSSVLQSLLESIQHRVHLLRTASLSSEGRTEMMLEELNGIVGAILARDADRAAQLCSAHVRNAAAVAFRSISESVD